MLDQNTFIETVQSVAEIIRTSAEPIGRDEIMSYFKDMELNKAHVRYSLPFIPPGARQTDTFSPSPRRFLAPRKR